MSKVMSHEARAIRRRKISQAVKSGDSVSTVARQFKVTETMVKGACDEARVPHSADCLVRGAGKVLLIVAQLSCGRKTMTAIGDIPEIRVTCEYVRQVLRRCRTYRIPVHSRYKREK